jgi:NtrC-family two-component system sensor histidine kinase KinB
MWVYIIVAIVSMVVAFLIAKAVESSGITKVSASRRADAEALGSDIVATDSLSQVISEELIDVIDSENKRNQVSKTVSDVFTQELEKRVNKSKEELSKKYAKFIEEKSRSEEIALRKYKKVLSEKKSTEAVIRSIAEGLVVINAEGKVIMMNPAAEKLLGTSKKEKLGQSLVDDLTEDQMISLVKGSPEKDNKEIELISQADETKKVLRASTAVVENENGQTVGMVSVLSDITKQKELDALKSRFVASVSHELRTPLVAIDKSVTLLLSKAAGSLSGSQEEFLSIAKRNLTRLSTLINDLLDMSKLEAGKMRLNFEVSSIADIINESVKGFQSWADTKSISLIIKTAEGLPKVKVDSQRIIQIMNNLIGNAIKFAPNKGQIFVEANLKDDKVRVSVQDTGPGIAKDDLSKIFDKFYQVSERSSTDIGGTGLGLSIAKEIVELHGGSIWAESDIGQGAKFIFTLPLQK